MSEADKQIIADFLKTQQLATLSTVDAGSGRPQAALIAFAELDTLEIVFQTFSDSRKYHNLLHNLAVALVIGWSLEDYITMQYEGEAIPIAQAEASKYHEAFKLKNSPSSSVFLEHPKARFFIVKPSWIRYSDYGCGSPQTIEIKF